MREVMETNEEHPIDLSKEYRQKRFKVKDGTQGHLKWLDMNCHICGAQCNSWDRRVWNALMYNLPRCERCIAKEYGETIEDLRTVMQEEFGMQPCAGI